MTEDRKSPPPLGIMAGDDPRPSDENRPVKKTREARGFHPVARNAWVQAYRFLGLALLVAAGALERPALSALAVIVALALLLLSELAAISRALEWQNAHCAEESDPEELELSVEDARRAEELYLADLRIRCAEAAAQLAEAGRHSDANEAMREFMRLASKLEPQEPNWRALLRVLVDATAHESFSSARAHSSWNDARKALLRHPTPEA
jgi:hypothetical protein